MTSIPSEWYNSEHTIIKVSYPLTWTANEMFDMLKQVNELAKSVDHPVCVIFDTRKTSGLPMNIIAHTRTLVVNRHPNIAAFVVYSQSLFLRVMYNTFKRIYPNLAQHFRFADTLEALKAVLVDLQIESKAEYV